MVLDCEPTVRVASGEDGASDFVLVPELLANFYMRALPEGKSDREIRRCLKRHLARRIFKLLQRVDSL